MSEHDELISVPGALAAARAVPDATVGRLAVYLRVLGSLVAGNTATVSSEELAAAAGVNSAKLRKDLSFLGSYGTRGVGYDVATLTVQIQRALGLSEDHTIVVVGAGNLGRALAGYAGFASRGLRVGAIFDVDEARISQRVGTLLVEPIAHLRGLVAELRVTIAVIATPGEAAQAVADLLVSAGVTSILNFAPVVLNVPGHVDVRKVDLAAELQILAFHEQRKSGRLPMDQLPLDDSIQVVS
jgi:redox-sensing transcriptional repressor